MSKAEEKIKVNNLEELLKKVNEYLSADKYLKTNRYINAGEITHEGNNQKEKLTKPSSVGVILTDQKGNEVDIFIEFALSQGFACSESYKLFEELSKKMEKIPKVESPKNFVKPVQKVKNHKIKVNNAAEFLVAVKKLIANERIEFFQRSFAHQKEWSKEGKFQGAWKEFAMKFRSPAGIIKIYSKNDNFSWKDSDQIELDKLLSSQTTQKLTNSKISESKQNYTKKEQEIRDNKNGISNKNLPKSSNKGLVLGIGLGTLIGAALMGIIIYFVNRKKNS